MYQSYVFIEVRIQLPAVDKVFVLDENSKKIGVDKDVLRRVLILSRALGCKIFDISDIEKITGINESLQLDFKNQINSENQQKSENQTNLKNQLEESLKKQFTGYSIKIAKDGFMNILFHSRQKSIKIEEVRIEEDSGRLTHANGIARMDYSCLGFPSIRIKTAASFELGEEVQIFLEELRRLTQYLHITQEGAKNSLIRCNAYVSFALYPEKPNYFVKLRNLNSFNFARKAVNDELTRQENMISSGEEVTSHSRIWNEHKSCTEFYQERQDEISHFERINPCQTFNIEKARQNIELEENVELPEERRQRLKKQYGVSRLRAEFLCDFKDRADFFENVVAFGAKPLNAAHWMASELTRLLNKKGITISQSKINAEQFAFIIKKLDSGELHSASAKTLLRATFESGTSPEKLIKTLNISEIGTEKELFPYVKKVILENPGPCKSLQNGEMAALEFLTGLVMKETKGKAVPQIVKSLIKQELNISVIYVITTGGAISAVRHADGTISSGDGSVIKEIVANVAKDIPVQIISAGQYLSEELEPANWSELICEVALRISAGTANGIVITHGTYTLSYTAALLFWLFSDSGVPIVLTASSALHGEGTEASDNLQLAIKTAQEQKNGVYVVYKNKILSPLNLHFDKPGSFSNWNLKESLFIDSGPLSSQFSNIGELDKDVITRLLVEASGKMFLCHLYPGFRSDLYKQIIAYSHIHSIFIEMYGIGSGNMNNSDFSLKPILLSGNSKGIKFYCTSQQKINLDFSQYVTARNVWREGAVPMGYLTTESAIALYFACAIAADNQDEQDELMETYSSIYGD